MWRFRRPYEKQYGQINISICQKNHFFIQYIWQKKIITKIDVVSGCFNRKLICQYDMSLYLERGRVITERTVMVPDLLVNGSHMLGQGARVGTGVDAKLALEPALVLGIEGQ